MCGCKAHNPDYMGLCTCNCEVHKFKEKACDACRLLRADCPGIAAHCAAGQHCIDNDSVCSMDYSRDDHEAECCSCKANMRRNPRKGRSA